MAEGERTAAEREAARLERERRRAGAPEVDRPQADGDGAPFEADPAHGGEDWLADEEFEDAEPPLGTRRVAHSERTARRPSRARARGRQLAKAKRARPQTRGPRRWTGRIFALVILALAVAAIYFVISIYQPFHAKPHGRVTVVIPANSGASQIGDILAAKGVVASSFFFELHATLSGDRSKLRSGTFVMQYDMSYSAALKLLTTAPPAAKVSNLTLIEGLSRARIAGLLRAQHISGNYLADTRHSPLLDPTRYGAPRNTPSLEGFLFPSTYQLRDPITASALIADQLKQFQAEFSKVNLQFARSKHLTPYDVLIIASMIQAEAQTARDRPLIASVIYNRLRDGMPLQIDATTRYATGNYTSPLTDSQLKSPSPYNTRIHTGLPPTPIDNPGMAAIQAAANPANTHYLYFVVKPCGRGEHVFESSYSQFLNDVARYQAARQQRGGSPEHC